jgi:hypothetical protein
MALVYRKIAAWARKSSPGSSGTGAVASLAAALGEFKPESADVEGVRGLISAPGYKSATRNLLTKIAAKTTVTQEDLTELSTKADKDKEKCEKKTGLKGPRPYADVILKDVEATCGFTYLQDGGPARHSEFAVMLDHAARRVSMAHTWIKLAEAGRSKFEKDAQKINPVPEAAKRWLDQFCKDRSQASGALEPYRIRLRAVDGWSEVVAAWSKSDCKTEADRVAAARALQDDQEIDKFGDIQLFEALAEDDALCVWHKDGDPAKPPDPQLLIDYALAAEAGFKRSHFKVPAYRHPDALRHPIFCDFGESRWKICFGIHQNPQTPFPRNVCLTLWTGNAMQTVPLCWQSKRLARDLALGQDAQNPGACEVTRADRFERAASIVAGGGKVKIAALFEQEFWNGRLQAPRRQLEAIANRVDRHEEWDETAKKMRDRLQWLVTFSARLQPQDPWRRYASLHHLRLNPQYWPHADENKTRKGQARLTLSRLPGLRVLSVDLGLRYAAACVVWETVDRRTGQGGLPGAGRDDPKGSDLYLHLKEQGSPAKAGKPPSIAASARTPCRTDRRIPPPGRGGTASS